MKKFLAILLLGLMFCTSSLADNLNNYKYKNYKKNTVKVNFDSIIPKMRAEMFDEKREKHSVTVNNVTLTKGYNKDAHEDSIKQVFSFLSK